MAAWKTFRVTLDVLVKADDADELPDADAAFATMQQSFTEEEVTHLWACTKMGGMPKEEK